MPRKPTGQVLERRRNGGRRVFALRFRAYGKRHYLTLPDGTTRDQAELELENVLADVRRGVWRPPEPEPEVELKEEPTFHRFASEWLAMREHELSERTIEDYKWALSQHLLPYFAKQRLSRITAEDVDRYTAVKAREERLSNNSVNKTLTRLRQVLEDAVEYGYIKRNPAAGRRRRLKSDAPKRERMEAEQVAALLAAVKGTHRALLATAIMAGGLRVSEVTGLRWRDVNLASGWLSVEDSKTEAGIRRVDLEPDLLDELKAHKAVAVLSSANDFVFPGKAGKRRDRSAVTRRVLYPAIKKANAKLAEAGRPTIPEGVTFHGLRRTFAALKAEAGEHPAVTAAQIGHRDHRFTLNVYTDVRNRRAQVQLGGLLRGTDWAPLGTSEEKAPELPGGLDGMEGAKAVQEQGS